MFIEITDSIQIDEYLAAGLLYDSAHSPLRGAWDKGGWDTPQLMYPEDEKWLAIRELNPGKWRYFISVEE